MKEWMDKIQAAESFLSNAHEHGRKVYQRYEDERESFDSVDAKKANFFYANVNTQKESLYNSPPKPSVERLNKGNYNDDVARVASLIMSRCLEYQVHCAEGFEESINAAILDRLVPGIGQVWVQFVEDGKLKIEYVFWEDFLYEPVRTWSACGWVARRIPLTKDEIKEKFGKDIDAESMRSEDDTPEEILRDKLAVYEIWDKKSRKVLFVTKGVEEPLKTVDDPMKIRGFFPCPRPLIANPTSKKFLPITDYHFAQDQYIQIDILYGRIQLIIEAIKVAGLYDSSNTGIQNMLQRGENSLIPVDNWAMFAERGGAKGMIDWYPVEQVATVLQHLTGQFEFAKQILYEITGMADIVRGASNQYETAAAQQIKAQFASVRLGGAQREVAKFVRGVLRIMADVIGSTFSDEKIAAMVQPLSEPDMQYAQQGLQILRSPEFSAYKVDIQADSLTQADWALEKQQRMEIVGTLGQMIAQALPMAEQVPEMATLVAQLTKFAVAGFKGSIEIEGWLDQQIDQLLQRAQQPQPPKPNPEQQKMQLEQQKTEQKMQLEQQKGEREAQKMQMEMQMEQQKHALEVQKAEMDIRMKQMELMFKKQEAQLDLMIQMMKGRIEGEQAQQKMQFEAVSGQQKLELQERQGEQSLAQTEAMGQQKIKQAKQQAKQKPAKDK